MRPRRGSQMARTRPEMPEGMWRWPPDGVRGQVARLPLALVALALCGTLSACCNIPLIPGI